MRITRSRHSASSAVVFLLPTVGNIRSDGLIDLHRARRRSNPCIDRRSAVSRTVLYQLLRRPRAHRNWRATQLPMAATGTGCLVMCRHLRALRTYRRLDARCTPGVPSRSAVTAANSQRTQQAVTPWETWLRHVRRLGSTAECRPGWHQSPAASRMGYFSGLIVVLELPPMQRRVWA